MWEVTARGMKKLGESVDLIEGRVKEERKQFGVIWVWLSYDTDMARRP